MDFKRPLTDFKELQNNIEKTFEGLLEGLKALKRPFESLSMNFYRPFKDMSKGLSKGL